MAEPPPVECDAVADGILRLKIPVPIRELGFVNVYAIEDGPGWTVVDAGMDDAPTRAAWLALLAEGPLADRPVSRILVTHYHPDHLGVAGFLAAETEAEVTMLPAGFDLARDLAAIPPAEVAVRAAAHYRRCGFTAGEAAAMAGDGGMLSRLYSALPETVTPLVAGGSAAIGGTVWEVIETAGHAPHHACLWSAERGILIAGDQVLPSISPNVGVSWWSPELDGVGAFLSSNARLAALAGIRTVLPGHGDPFADLAGRAAVLAGHHGERLAALAAALADGPLTIKALLPFLFRRPLADFHLLLAVGEALSHANHLVATGAIRRTEADGVVRFAR